MTIVYDRESRIHFKDIIHVSKNRMCKCTSNKLPSLEHEFSLGYTVPIIFFINNLLTADRMVQSFEFETMFT